MLIAIKLIWINIYPAHTRLAFESLSPLEQELPKVANASCLQLISLAS